MLKIAGDVLIQDFVEHYVNLTVKSVMMLKFIRELDFLNPKDVLVMKVG